MRAWVWIALIAAILLSVFLAKGLLAPTPVADEEEDAGGAIRRPRRRAPTASSPITNTPAARPKDAASATEPEETLPEVSDAPGEATARVPRRAEDALDHLLSVLGAGTWSNEEILLAMEDVGRDYHDPEVRRHPAFLSKIEKALRSAMTLRKTEERSPENLREAVNVRAAELLVATGNPKISKYLTRALEKDLQRAKRRPPSEPLMKTVLDGLATLNEEKSLAWMTETFVQSKRRLRDTPGEDSETKARNLAFGAMRRFSEVPGERRYQTFERMVRTFADVEARAVSGERGEKVAQAERLWSEIGEQAVETARHFAGYPAGPNGQRIETMAALQEWFREHENAKGPPWSD